MNVPALRFKEFNGDWYPTIFDEILDITRLAGYEYSTYWREDENKEIIALRGYNVGKGKLDLIKLGYISNELSLQLKRSKLFIGDIVYPCVGTIGNAAVIEENNKYHIQQNIAKLTPKENISSYFIVQFLMSNRGVNEVYRFNATSSQPNILVGSLRNFRIFIPSLPEQTKIANFLTAVDDKITLLTKKADLLSQYKKGVMQQIFSQELRFKDDDGQEFPEWEEKTIADIFHRNTHSSKSDFIVNDGIYIIVDMGSISRDARLLVTKRTNFSTDCLTTNDLVMAKDDIGGGNIIGRVVQIPENNKYICSDHVYKLTIKEDGYTQYIGYFYYVINSFKINKSFRQKANGTAQIGISNKTVDDQILPVPILPEQTKIANFLTAIDEKITNNQTQLDAVKQYKQGLLQQMFV